MSKTRLKREKIIEELHVGMAVRKTVRNMAYNLENVITNLHGIVGDLHVLVTQIDSVANKMDTRNGFKKPENGIKNHFTHYTPVNDCSESLSSKGFVAHNIRNWQDLLESCESQDFSPDLDWSYLGLSGDPKPVKTISDETNIHITDQPLTADMKRNSLLHNACSQSSVIPENNGTKFFRDVLFSQFREKSKDNDIRESIQITVPYDGCYEQAVDDILENLAGEDEESDFSDTETYSDVLTTSSTASTQSNDSSCSSIEFQAEYNRQMNPWTTFSSVVDVLDSDDIFGSKANTLDSKDSIRADDILNDNYLESKYLSCGFDSHHVKNGLVYNNYNK